MYSDIALEKQAGKRRVSTGTLYLQPELYGEDITASAWQQRALADFASRAGDEAFPCLFCRKAWKDGTIRFLFAECGPDLEYDDLLLGLTDYTNFVQRTDIKDRLLTPLVVFFETSRLQSGPLHTLGWDILNWVHRMDPAPWPADVPDEPDQADWSFCFNGVQLFVNMSSPEHEALRSRNLGGCLTFVINPRENFDALASLKTRSGKLVRERIRARVAAFNGGAVPQELGFYGDENNREWMQYQLEEDSLPRPAACPFSPRKSLLKKPGSA
ncbi:YqcI/YcgG family protein [Cribrihabitans neustonicus]|uniref:YqcI/YcgG family protein n=1 Tax=Cribrihabitans neustonicus TaxID=1429085 RepID=UPI003B592088